MEPQLRIEFFELSTQLIPLLYIALAVDYRFHERPTNTLLGRVSTSIKLTAFMVSGFGLFVALYVTATGEQSWQQLLAVLVAYAVLAAGLGARLFMWLIDANDDAIWPALLPFALLAVLYGIGFWVAHDAGWYDLEDLQNWLNDQPPPTPVPEE